jgi:hypothetical protein
MILNLLGSVTSGELLVTHSPRVTCQPVTAVHLTQRTFGGAPAREGEFAVGDQRLLGSLLGTVLGN